MSRNRWLRLFAVLLGLTLIAAACGDDDDGSSTDDSTETSGGDTDTSEDEGATGGTLILGAEQFPECLNPITQCANSSWMHWAVTAHVLPRLMELDPEGNFVPSPVLDGEPELAGEGVDDSGDPFSVTYHINEDAVWDDGTPITSADIEFTWHTYIDSTGSITKVGFEKIESIDTTEEKTAVVTFTEPFADWQDLFGGNSSYVLKADFFESTDTAEDLLTELPFSGGPFKLEAFSTDSATLVRNDAYWDEERIPLVDSVEVVAMTDSETELNALAAGEVMAIFPQPAPGINETLGAENIKLTFGAGTTYEGLWFNQNSLKAGAGNVLADLEVREAVAYGINRERIIDEVLHPISPELEMLNCGGWVPTVGDWCDQEDFADITYDPEQAASILEDAGWAKGADGIYAKDGKRLSFTWQTVAGNARREAIQAIVIPELAEIGIEVTADNSDADTLFQTRLPQLDTEMALYAQVTSPDPSVTSIFHCDNIPSAENEFAGQNSTSWCNEEASELMSQSDQTPATDERLEIIHQIGDLVRQDMVWLPFYQLPLVGAVDTDQVSGPVDLYVNSPYSTFENIYDWSVVQ